jgi:hypothetical protein
MEIRHLLENRQTLRVGLGSFEQGFDFLKLFPISLFVFIIGMLLF